MKGKNMAKPIKPGEKLARNNELTQKIKAISEYLASSNGTTDMNDEFEKLLSEIKESIGTDVDSYKFLIDLISTFASQSDGRADHYSMRSLTFNMIKNGIEKHIMELMSKGDGDIVSGETWTYKKIKIEPRFEIHSEELTHYYKKQILVPDHDKIDADHKAKKKIKGLVVHERFALVAEVNKKAAVSK